jgi:hypothetical protein
MRISLLDLDAPILVLDAPGVGRGGRRATTMTQTISARRDRARKLLAIYRETSGLISYLTRATAEYAPDNPNPDFEAEARASWYAFEAIEENEYRFDLRIALANLVDRDLTYDNDHVAGGQIPAAHIRAGRQALKGAPNP